MKMTAIKDEIRHKSKRLLITISAAAINLATNNTVLHHQETAVIAAFIKTTASKSFPKALIWHNEEKFGGAPAPLY
jgi:hypothetical protein